MCIARLGNDEGVKMSSKQYDKQIEFRAKPIKCVFNADDFKVYGCEINSVKYPYVKINKFNNVSICGNLPVLTIGTEYEIAAIEEDGRYGTSYRVSYIQRDVPETKDGILAFLQEVLTAKQANTIYDEYPDIIDRVRNNRLDDIDLDKLDGIGEYRFNKIKQNIVDNFAIADIISEFKGVFNKSIAQKIHNEYTSVDKFKDAFREDPYSSLISISGIGFKKSDELILKMQDSNAFDFGYDVRTSIYRCLSCVLYLLKENEEHGSTKSNIATIRSKCIKMAPECIECFEQALEHKDIFCDKSKMVMGIYHTYKNEEYIAQRVTNMIKDKSNMWDYDIEKYRFINNASLSDEQMSFLQFICDNKFTLLTAPAGSGKSFATKALINMLEDNNKRYICMSPTGKAAKRLSEYTERRAYTIHKILAQVEEFEDNEENENLMHPLDTDVIIIDEAGMVSVNLFSRLLRNTKHNVRLVLIGDIYQLNSIGCGALLRDLFQDKKVPKVEFTKVFRMGEGGCLTACTYVRQNKRFIEKNHPIQLGADKSYNFIPATKENMNDKIISLYKTLIKNIDPKDITVISSFNIGESGCDKLNKLLQPIANPKAKDDRIHISFGKDDKKISYYEGDSVIQIKNKYDFNRNLLVANGEHGIIERIADDNGEKVMVIQFENSRIIYAENEVQNNIKHAFALSTHKMQGSQNKIIIFCCPSSHIFFLSNNIIYTAISRAEKIVFHFGDAKTINSAMNKSDVENRQTFLGDILKSFNSPINKQIYML